MSSSAELYRRWLVLACFAAIAGCAGSASGVGVTPVAIQISSSSQTVMQDVPVDGRITFGIVPSLGLRGSISFPVVPGAGGTSTLTASTSALADLPPLSGPPLNPQPAEYFCVSFSAHQIPVSAPAMSLTTSPSETTSGVGLAYFQPAANSWNELYGIAPFTPSVSLVARDAVFYRPDRTCFALYLTSITPLPT